jgi:hypothetical protein
MIGVILVVIASILASIPAIFIVMTKGRREIGT